MLRESQYDTKEIQHLAGVAEKRKEHVVAALKRVPSPMAVGLRGVVLAAAGILLVMGLPFAL